MNIPSTWGGGQFSDAQTYADVVVKMWLSPPALMSSTRLQVATQVVNRPPVCLNNVINGEDACWGTGVGRHGVGVPRALLCCGLSVVGWWVDHVTLVTLWVDGLVAWW